MMHLHRRANPSKLMGYLAPLIALVFTLLAGFVLFAAVGVPIGDAFHAYFIDPISDRYGLAELGVKAAPLIMIAAALSLGFRAGVWNIGAEGQLILGGICGGAVGLYFYEVEANYVLPLMCLAGVLGGMLWAAIPAFLKTVFNANEILTSLMLTYVATLLLSLLVHGPLRDPDGFNFPESRLFHDAATLPVVLSGTRLHIGAPVAIFVALLSWLLLSRTLLGFALRVNGAAPRAARHTGFSQAKLVWFSLLFTGALAGLAGLFEVSGPIGQLTPVISLVMALSYLGGESAQITLNMPLAVTGVFQGMLLFFLLAADVLIHYQIRFGRGQAHVN